MTEQQNLATVVVAALVSFIGGGGLIGMVTLIANRKKTDAEIELTKANSEKVLSGAAVQFVQELRADVLDLRQQAAEQSAKAKSLDLKIQILEDHVKVQLQIIMQLRTALAEYNPAHELLRMPVPEIRYP